MIGSTPGAGALRFWRSVSLFWLGESVPRRVSGRYGWTAPTAPGDLLAGLEQQTPAVPFSDLLCKRKGSSFTGLLELYESPQFHRHRARP
jgi:hypothetical protein